MDDRACLGTRIAERVDVRHDIVAELLFVLRGGFVVDVRDVRFHLRDLLVRDVHTERLLRPRKCDPEPPERRKLHIGGKQILHLVACIARGKRVFITGMV